MSAPLRRTVLHSFHLSRKARMGPFAGYEMPIQYPGGASREHLHTRRAAGLFDLSYFGYIELHGADREKFFEWLTPSCVSELPEGQSALTIFMNEAAGVKDDCIVSKLPGHLLAVVNAGCKEKDVAHLRARLAEFKGDVTLVELDRAMVSLQGPMAAAALAPYVEDLDKMLFMRCRRNVRINGIDTTLTRCSYSGEDGFDIIMKPEDALPFVEVLLRNPEVQMCGLAARDSLRIEAGLCLYSHELAEDIDPVAARIAWCVPRRRMAEGGFIGHERLVQLVARPKELVPRVRVGVTSVTKGPVPRTGMPILLDGKLVGEVTSGVPSPTLGRHIAMGYADRAAATVGQLVEIDVRGRRVPGEIVLPRFVSARYYKG
ncbi:putative glycine synthase [Trypanosoma grayi]|uniref:putative glycine synthase n=1 Tax=Trypanosoma grayi TaxID=71804 RepID=UPI0004F4284D|nr:putative glycine synthase [Trypanosoma grayi]KEG07640.1 putative glycine synthase [Trypanosoma grayi]